MKKIITKLSILIISSAIAVFSINAAINKHQKPAIKDVLENGQIELLENAIIIDSLSEETDSEDYHNLKNSFEYSVVVLNNKIGIIINIFFIQQLYDLGICNATISYIF